MTERAVPVFSVVIATWNWSCALRLALQSVLAQSFTDFEVLVVGDGCTDDSAEVVAAFGDPRLRWHNLDANCGSQWAPNNHALSIARGEYIAYLGHDDLWWPTHLLTAHEVFLRTGADIVCAVCLMYGPPDSGVHAVTGLCPNGQDRHRYFCPPSSLRHRRDVARRAGGWRAPEHARVAVDVDFLRRCADTGAKIAATEELTVFKFNAAWRRDSYRRREVDEQRRCLAAMREEGEAFRTRQLAHALRSAVEDRLVRIDYPPQADASATISAETNQRFKGTRRAAVRVPEQVGGRRRYTLDDEMGGFEWHGIERQPGLGTYRWSGPSTRVHIVLPEPVHAPLEIAVLVVHAIDDDVLASLRLAANDVSLESRFEPGPAHARLLCARIDPAQLPADDCGELRLCLSVARTWRPLDLDINDDRRWLGVGIGWVEIAEA